MLRSMTGFGRYEAIDESKKLIIEMKAVNHRYCDINIRMPKKFGLFENALRSVLKKYVQRGKVDIFITYEDYTEGHSVLKYNEELAKDYMNHFATMSQSFEIENDIKVSHLSKCPEVLILEQQALDEDALWKGLEKAITKASEQLVVTRTTEGQLLKRDLEQKLQNMLDFVEIIKERSPNLLSEYKSKLENRLNELLNDSIVDEARLATELVVFADKACIDEEIVRLESHIKHMKQSLNSDEGIGRKLDFIAQEMNREANTILSKANDLQIANVAIDLKTEIEKIREQIQNIE